LSANRKTRKFSGSFYCVKSINFLGLLICTYYYNTQILLIHLQANSLIVKHLFIKFGNFSALTKSHKLQIQVCSTNFFYFVPNLNWSNFKPLSIRNYPCRHAEVLSPQKIRSLNRKMIGSTNRECISTDQPDEDQCYEHQRSADQRLYTSTKIF
jgi:hypothetical protein